METKTKKKVFWPFLSVNFPTAMSRGPYLYLFIEIFKTGNDFHGIAILSNFFVNKEVSLAFLPSKTRFHFKVFDSYFSVLFSFLLMLSFSPLPLLQFIILFLYFSF